MHVLSEDDLPILIHALQSFFPQSLQLFCQARNILHKTAFWPGTEIVVDIFPDFNVCLSRPTPGSDKYIPRPREGVQAVTVFSKSPEALLALLNQDDIIDWYRPICFISIQSEMVETVVQRGELFGHFKGTQSKAFVFSMTPKSFTPIEKSDLPVGYSTGSLNVSHIPQIVREWNFAGRGGDPESARPFFAHVLTNGSPTFGVFTDDGELVAYALYSPNGSISQGYVREEHRKKGLFKLVIRGLAEKIFKELHQPITWGHVHDDNLVSAAAFKSVGGKLESNWTTQVLDYMPYT